MDKRLNEKLLNLLMPYHPVRVSIFGSYARGEHSKTSDLDVMVAFKEGIGLLKLVQIEQELSDALGISIDLLTENSIKNPRLKAAIQKDIITIFG
jgi:hypothetical protein